MKAFSYPQYSPEWWAARRGVITASEVGPFIVNTTKVAEKARKRLCAQKIGEVAGADQDTFQNDAMKRGTALEPYARACYQRATGHHVQEVGFISDIARCIGGSPDGIVLWADATIDLHPDGSWDILPNYVSHGLEIKCPETAAKHIQWFLADELPDEHEYQCHMGMILTGAPYWDFMSYFPAHVEFIKTRDSWTVADLDEGGMPPFIKRVERSALTANLESGLAETVAEFRVMRSAFLAKCDAHQARILTLQQAS